jgi:hypothetical protein
MENRGWRIDETSENEQLAAVRLRQATARQGMPPKLAGKMPALRRQGGNPRKPMIFDELRSFPMISNHF